MATLKYSVLLCLVVFCIVQEAHPKALPGAVTPPPEVKPAENAADTPKGSPPQNATAPAPAKPALDSKVPPPQKSAAAAPAKPENDSKGTPPPPPKSTAAPAKAEKDSKGTPPQKSAAPAPKDETPGNAGEPAAATEPDPTS